MGASVTKNISSNVINALTKVSSTILQDQLIGSTQSQIITIHGVTGDVEISGVSQSQRVNLNMQMLMQAMATEAAQQNLAAELAQSAKSLTSGLNLAQFSMASNTMDALITASIDLIAKIGQNCAIQQKQYESIDISNVNGRVKITDVAQEQLADIFSNCVESAVNDSQAIQDISSKLSQTASATSQGLSEWMLAIIAAAIIGIPVIGGVVGGVMFLKYIFPILVVAGVVLLILYFVYTDETIEMIGYSTLIANTNDCANTKIGKTTTYTSVTDAANACMNDAECRAFDWNVITLYDDNEDYDTIIPPETTFYSSVSDSCKDSIKQDSLKLTRIPFVRSGNGSPTISKSDNPGDVYIDRLTSTWYRVNKNKSFDIQSRIVKEPFTQLIVNSRKPSNIDSGVDDSSKWIYYDANKPIYFHVYEYKADQPTQWSEIQQVPGPGIVASVPTETNGSGFKVRTRKPWMLYSGIAAICLGAIGSIYTLTMKTKEKA
jgi:hypothetical protein